MTSRTETVLTVAIATILGATLALMPGEALAKQGDCGQPVSHGAGPTAGDCAYDLHAAVQAKQCDDCVCDTDGSGALTAADSLACLQAANGNSGHLSCPVCSEASSTSSASDATTGSSQATAAAVVGDTCELVFSVITPALVGGLQWDTDYFNAPGNFATRTTPSGSVVVDCTNLAAGALFAVNDKIDQRILSAAFATIEGINTPAPVMSCRFVSDGGAPVPSDFPIIIVDSVDTEGFPIFVQMVVEVTGCDSTPTCGDNLREGTEECDGFDDASCPGRCSSECTCMPGPCLSDLECSVFDNPCVVGYCDFATGLCGIEPLPAGTWCDDYDVCTENDFCDGTGICVSGYPVICDDGNQCTFDTCFPFEGCYFEPWPYDGAPCEDGSVCTIADTCWGGYCSGAPLICDDSDICTDDWCEDPNGCQSIYDPSNDPICEAPAGTGRMTGGGRFTFDEDSNDGLTHAFRLNCDPARTPNRLRVVWRQNGQRYRFRLTHMRTASCLDNPGIGQAPPAAGFDTHLGEGTGTLQVGRDRQSGAVANWRFTDAGEPNTQDITEIIISDPVGLPVLATAARLFVGNHQAHEQ